ncbi:MAG: hypothetical protein AAGA30_18970, partial [Planctomycetota bacterium]
VKQWQQMRTRARSGDANAKRKYEQRLKSLGFSPKTFGREVKARKEKDFQLNEDGAVDQIPSEYLEKFNSFLKRRNRSKRRSR